MPDDDTISTLPRACGPSPRPRPPVPDAARDDHGFTEPLAGRYRVMRRLGRGGMGVVFAALDRDGKQVAVKFVDANDSRALVRLKTEYRRMEGIVHPNLVTLYGLGFHRGQPFIVMEYIDGVDFHRAVRGEQDTFDPTRLAALLRPLAEGICTLHEAWRVHRDLKCSNVMVGADGRVVLLDFGLVDELHRRTLYASSLGDKLEGTPLYMAPEQGAGQLSTPASDWYALGVMLFRAVTGAYPFEGSPFMALRHKLEQAAPMASTLAPGVPPELDELIARLLCRDPVHRASGIDVFAWCDRDTGGAPRPRPPARPGPTPQLFGRGHQIEALDRAVTLWNQRLPLRVSLVGAPGTGKTSLLRHFVRAQLERDPQTVILEGRCYEFDGIPLKAFDRLVDALGRYLRRLSPEQVRPLLDDGFHALAQLFPALRPLAPEGGAQRLKRRMGLPSVQHDPHEQRKRAFSGLRTLLHRIAVRQRLVLTIDDLQWGDVDSARLMTELLAPPAAPPLLLVCTYRDEDVERSPMLRELLASRTTRAQQHLAQVVRLGLIAEADAVAMAAHLLNELGRPSAIRARAIAAEAQGNPMLIEALVRHLGDEPEEELTRMTVARRQVSLEQLITRRLDHLDPPASALLAAVAVAGQPLEQALAVHVAGLTEDPRRAIAHLRGSHLIRTTRLDDHEALEIFDHRIGRAALARLDAAARAALHRSMAEALAGSAAPQRLAYHWYSAGDFDRAGELAREAAAVARARGSFGEACDLLRLACTCWPDDLDATRALAETLMDAGRLAESATLFLATAVRTRQPRTARQLRRTAAELLWRDDDAPQAIAAIQPLLIEYGLVIPAQDALARAQAKRLMQQLIRRGLGYREHSPVELRSRDVESFDVCMTLCRGYMMYDAIRGGLFAVQSALVALDLGEPRRIIPSLALAGLVVAERDDSLGQRWIEEAEGIAAAIHDKHALGFVAVCAGIAHGLRGAWGLAFEELEFGRRHLAVGSAWEQSLAAAGLLASLEALGEMTALELHSQQFGQLAQDLGERRLSGLAAVYAGLAALAADDPGRCLRRLGEALAAVRPGDYHLVQLLAWKLAVEHDLYVRRPERAWQRILKEWPVLERSTLIHARVHQSTALCLRARAGLALLAGGTARDGLLEIVEQDVVQLGRERAAHAAPHIGLLRAGLAALRGDPFAARRELGVASTGFDHLGMTLHATCARLCGASWDAAERAQLAQAEAFMRMQGVARPDAWTEMVAPAALSRRG